MGSDASVCFSWAGKGENVHVAGTWDHWQTPGLQLRKYVDDFHLSEICLPSGIHEVRSCYATPCFLNKGPARSPDALSSSSLSCGLWCGGSQYKYIIDGNWCSSDKEPTSGSDGNNVVLVKRSNGGGARLPPGQ